MLAAVPSSFTVRRSGEIFCLTGEIGFGGGTRTRAFQNSLTISFADSIKRRSAVFAASRCASIAKSRVVRVPMAFACTRRRLADGNWGLAEAMDPCLDISRLTPACLRFHPYGVHSRAHRRVDRRKGKARLQQSTGGVYVESRQSQETG